MWEAAHEGVADARLEDVWSLWSEPARWSDWNPDIERASLEGPFEVGATARIKFRRSASLRFTITELEPERLFTDETRLPLARMGHEHRVELEGDRVRIRNRLYIDGRAAPLYAFLMGSRMRRSVARFVELETGLAEDAARNHQRG